MTAYTPIHKQTAATAKAAARPTTLELLDAVIAKALSAREQAEAGNLHDSVEGYALYNAMFDLTDCDALYNIAQDIAHDIAPEPAPFAVWGRDGLPWGMQRPAIGGVL